ncbi:MAG: glycine--tRNA ligase [Candidatus Thermoplasmatota archaeon]|nr:glycine--tRNA ligase [Candidatus Thermoplasmatota archaeon]
MTLDTYDKIMMLAKRRGFLYPSFEIYGGSAGFYDYGPMGTRLKENLENLWRKYYLLKDANVEISTPTITLYDVLKASGHVDEFTDLTVDCKQCQTSFKVEDIIDENQTVEESVANDTITCPDCGSKLSDAHPVNLMFSTEIGIGKTRDAFLRPETAQGIFTGFHLLYRYAREKLPFGVVQLGKGYRNEVSPRQGPIRMREFSMAEAEIFFDPENKSHELFNEVKNHKLYLFDNVNEMKISMEKAVDEGIINNQALAFYMYMTQSILLDAGVDPKKFRFRKHADDELAHYAKECWDAELFSERFGWVECVGIADRSAYDLNAHITASKTDMYALRRYDEPKRITKKQIVPKMNVLGPEFKQRAGIIKEKLESMDAENIPYPITIKVNNEHINIPDNCYDIEEITETVPGDKFVPHVIEPSYGIDRVLYCLLEHNYYEETKNDELYHKLLLPPSMAPVKVGVFPLISDEKLIKIAKKLDKTFRENDIFTTYDDGGSIGRRYARMDEIGTPFCVTVDFESLDDNEVTIRNRDTTEQQRVPIDEVIKQIKNQLEKK